MSSTEIVLTAYAVILTACAYVHYLQGKRDDEAKRKAEQPPCQGCQNKDCGDCQHEVDRQKAQP